MIIEGPKMFVKLFLSFNRKSFRIIIINFLWFVFIMIIIN